MADHAVLTRLPRSAPADALRRLTTTGRFAGTVCRCLGGLTLLLLDETRRVLATAAVHGHGWVSWERTRFGNDLVVADPTGLHLFLAEHGVPEQLAPFLAPLADRLNLHRPSTARWRCCPGSDASPCPPKPSGAKAS